jgi:hypothetical protein
MNTEKEWMMRRKDSKNMQRAARASTKKYYTGKRMCNSFSYH